MKQANSASLLILNQMAGPITWELAEDLGQMYGSVALFTGHPDTLLKDNEHVQLYPAAMHVKGNFIQRVFSWVLYCLQSFIWLWRLPKQIPILFFSNPPILPWLGYLMKLIRNQPYIVMIHDIYPDVLVQTSTFSNKHPIVSIWRWVNKHVYEQSDLVMTLGEFMAANLNRQFDPTLTAYGRVATIPPWVNAEAIKPIPKSENWFAKKYNQTDKLTVMYSGNMGFGHDIETMLDAARKLQNNSHIHFFFIGEGPKWQLVNDAVATEALVNVTLLGWQPEEVIPYSLSTADISLVSLELGMEGIMLPSKGCYALTAGSALLFLARGQSELKSWIKSWGCGELVEPGDSKALVEKIRWLAQNPVELRDYRMRARREALHKFSRKNCTLHIFSLIQDVMEHRNLHMQNIIEK